MISSHAHTFGLVDITNERLWCGGCNGNTAPAKTWIWVNRAHVFYIAVNAIKEKQKRSIRWALRSCKMNWNKRNQKHERRRSLRVREKEREWERAQNGRYESILLFCHKNINGIVTTMLCRLYAYIYSLFVYYIQHNKYYDLNELNDFLPK